MDPAQAGGQAHDEAHNISEDNDSKVTILGPPNSSTALGLKCCNDIHSTVSISQHAPSCGVSPWSLETPRENLLQRFPCKGSAILEDVEGVEDTVLVALFLLLDV